MTPSVERTFARKAARRAAALCVAVQREMLGDPDRMDKVGREPVTVADYGAQAVICALLRAEFPNDRVVAEESGADFARLAESGQREQVARHVGEALGASVSPEEVQAWLDQGCDTVSTRVWMIDPIDGTKGFLRKEQFAVAIGFTHDGRLAAGALACPMLPVRASQPDGEVGLVLSADRDSGASAGPLAGEDEWPVSVSDHATPATARAVQSVESAHGDPAAATQTLAALGLTQPALRIDSQAKYAAVADGRAEVYLRTMSAPDFRERVWDHAAGAIIVTEAGGMVTDLYGEPLNFSLGTHLEANQGVLATNGHLHTATLAALRAAGVTG